MLTRRLTEPREVVSLLDPAMKQINPQVRIAYSLSRNMADLGDISQLAEPFAIFTLTPMLPKYQHLAGALHLLFAVHCMAAKNAPVDGADFETKDGFTSLDQKAMEKIPLDSVLELGQVVLDLASVDGVASPFTSAATDWESRIREAQRQDALRVATGLVKPSPTKPSASQKSMPDANPEPDGPSTQST